MKNWIIAFILVVALVVTGLFINNYIQTLRKENITLGVSNKKLNGELGIIKKEKQESLDLVDSLGKISYVLEAELKAKEIEIQKLKRDLANIPEVIMQIPVEESYEYLQLRYPDDSEKPYPLSEVQIQSVHIELASYDLLIGINKKLTESNQILKKQIQTKESIELGLIDVIESYNEENDILYNEISDLQLQNIKVRTQRNIFLGTTLTVASILGVIILL